MQRTDERYQAYVQILREELKPAMGCTEPIAVAYACAVARQTLGKLPQLECIAHVTDQDMEAVEEYLAQERVTILPLDTTHPFDILVEVRAGEDVARVRMVDQHTNLVHVSRNGQVLQEREVPQAMQENPLQQLLTVEDILDFADSVDLEDIRQPIQQQAQLNWAISQEGLEGCYGAMIGKELMAQAGNDWKARLRARAAAGSDARMSGCELPVVIVSGSGNQGLTASLPVMEYAAMKGIGEERMYRAMVVSNLLTVHQKTNLGRLSAFCGAVNAACAAAAAIAYLDGMGLDGVAHTLVNSLAVVSGMVCDGAKASCAAKISLALEAGLMGYEMYKAGHEFYDGDGIVKKGVENTLNMVARLGRLGMRETDREILRIMTGQ
ncbi:hypothetical protein B5F12_00125 [Pseudoflavonifractor sp. An176]|uniref:L-cysteine desulfidase family protein n=1 Tax=Pseudoflavonifractor sp. An176 TaxID=1965572 RepID=UPI000B398AB8|nr:L-serine ammonia-lyase, iron-sulfur-dependent, subunit alpha [Pseudoflavonifractor sp. An176]OUP65968.1 hypothetical protein B5F12_00125 [Pseudoflavonifractor sp. An176]